MPGSAVGHGGDDVDRAGVVADETPHGRGREVGEDRAGSAGQQGGELAAEGRERRLADRVHAPMNPVKATDLQTVRDVVAREARLQGLVATSPRCADAMLARTSSGRITSIQREW